MDSSNLMAQSRFHVCSSVPLRKGGGGELAYRNTFPLADKEANTVWRPRVSCCLSITNKEDGACSIDCVNTVFIVIRCIKKVFAEPLMKETYLPLTFRLHVYRLS